MNNFEVAINGIKIVAKLLNIPVPHFSFFDPSELSNKEITGMYVFESDEILFNELWVMKSTWIEVIITSFHETRHAYQAYCVRKGVYESNDVIKVWTNNFNNYIKPTGMNNEIDDIEYLKQPIELDAIMFVHKIVNELFGLKTIIPIAFSQ